MSTVLAFVAAFLAVIAVQSVRWVALRRRTPDVAWGDWMLTVSAWGGGWPIAFVVGFYVVSLLIFESLVRAG